jgi:hypothetical protein
MVSQSILVLEIQIKEQRSSTTPQYCTVSIYRRDSEGSIVCITIVSWIVTINEAQLNHVTQADPLNHARAKNQNQI